MLSTALLVLDIKMSPSDFANGAYQVSGCHSPNGRIRTWILGLLNFEPEGWKIQRQVY